MLSLSWYMEIHGPLQLEIQPERKPHCCPRDVGFVPRLYRTYLWHFDRTKEKNNQCGHSMDTLQCWFGQRGVRYYVTSTLSARFLQVHQRPTLRANSALLHGSQALWNMFWILLSSPGSWKNPFVSNRWSLWKKRALTFLQPQLGAWCIWAELRAQRGSPQSTRTPDS